MTTDNNEEVVGDNWLKSHDPEKLNMAEVDKGNIHPLLDFHYAALFARASELHEDAEKWLKDHPQINSEIDYIRASDLYRQLTEHAGENQELESVRKKITKGPYTIWREVNAHFSGYRDPILEILKTLSALQMGYVRRQNEKGAEAAKEIQRTRSAIGVTTTVIKKWGFTVHDIKALCAAIGRGEVSASVVTIDESAMRLEIGDFGRSIPGVDVFEDLTLMRRRT